MLIRWLPVLPAELFQGTPNMSNLFNANFAHNCLNVAIILVAAITAGLSAYGCVTLPTGALDCSASTIPPAWSGGLIAGLGGLKMAINIAPHGVSGLPKPQPPIDKGS